MEGEKLPGLMSELRRMDARLQKELNDFSLLQHMVERRYKVDQKLLGKRFQNKKLRTRLAAAEIQGNKELAVKIRQQTGSRLNTDVGK